MLHSFSRLDKKITSCPGNVNQLILNESFILN
jgi:hypothetical protein